MARTDNGADVIRPAVCKQPDLVLVGEALQTLRGEEAVGGGKGRSGVRSRRVA